LEPNVYPANVTKSHEYQVSKEKGKVGQGGNLGAKKTESTSYRTNEGERGRAKGKRKNRKAGGKDK